MTSVCMYFQVHQPVRLKSYSLFDRGNRRLEYFDRSANRGIFEKVSKKCYLPANENILKSIIQTEGRFRVSYSITGVMLEQARKYCPEVVDSFRRLVDTGCVELLNETYYHSLAGLHQDKSEFIEQIKMHRELISDLFGYEAKVFRNTEVLYDNEIGKVAEALGYEGIITEGLDHILGWRSPNFVYRPAGRDKIKLLFRNYPLSDDIAFRFSSRGWDQWPLTADKFSSWLAASQGQTINLFMDYETFGEHHWEETGIFSFLEHLPSEVLKHDNLEFMTPVEVVRKYNAKDTIDVPWAISWADLERDSSAWLGNPMQQACFNELMRLGPVVRRAGGRILETWRRLLTSDHLYYLSTKGMGDGDVHCYFNKFESPYEAFINYMNVINDFKERVNTLLGLKERAREVYRGRDIEKSRLSV